MVGEQTSRFRFTTVDVVGGAVFATIVLACAWLLTMRFREQSDDMATLTTELNRAQSDLAALRLVHDRQAEQLRLRRKEIATSGWLPDHAPVESILKSIGEAAAARELTVVAQKPLSARTYPGVREERYAYDVVGASGGIAGLLGDIERSGWWCDVSFLSVESITDDAPPRVRASLTLSLFSSTPTVVPGPDRAPSPTGRSIAAPPKDAARGT